MGIIWLVLQAAAAFYGSGSIDLSECKFWSSNGPFIHWCGKILNSQLYMSKVVHQYDYFIYL